jgi:hypothetical protein
MAQPKDRRTAYCLQNLIAMPDQTGKFCSSATDIPTHRLLLTKSYYDARSNRKILQFSHRHTDHYLLLTKSYYDARSNRKILQFSHRHTDHRLLLTKSYYDARSNRKILQFSHRHTDHCLLLTKKQG